MTEFTMFGWVLASWGEGTINITMPGVIMFLLLSPFGRGIRR